MSDAVEFKLTQHDSLWIGRFRAMASPCELLIETDTSNEGRKVALRALRVVYEEAKRIEAFWSRYLPGNIIDRINTANGCPIKVDDETASLLDLAAQLWSLSDGRFDITSGLLRKAWVFDGSDNIPSPEVVQKLMPLIGWDKVIWQRPYLTLRPNMQLDFGGIGKEYAVDSCITLASQITSAAMVVNLGGDIQVNKARLGNQPWHIGIEQAEPVFNQSEIAKPPQKKQETLLVYSGAIATSGNAYRYLEKNEKRYSHVLDAKTGWPVDNAPSSVTVISKTCTEAGILSSLAMLQGENATEFLKAQGVRYYVK